MKGSAHRWTFFLAVLVAAAPWRSVNAANTRAATADTTVNTLTDRADPSHEVASGSSSGVEPSGQLPGSDAGLPRPTAASSTDKNKWREAAWRALSLFGLLAAAGLASFMYRQHRKQTDPSSDIIVLSTKHIGGKHRVALLDVEGQRVLVSLGDYGVSLISALGEASKPVPFAKLLEQSEHKSAALPPIATKSARSSEEVEGIIRLREQRRQGKEGAR